MKLYDWGQYVYLESDKYVGTGLNDFEIIWNSGQLYGYAEDNRRFKEMVIGIALEHGKGCFVCDKTRAYQGRRKSKKIRKKWDVTIETTVWIPIVKHLSADSGR